MKKISSLPAYVSPVPSEPIDLNENSIVIVDDEIEYLVGDAAMSQKPDSTRRFGGTLQRPEYRRLLKALVASMLGEGHHSIKKVSLSAPMPYLNQFRNEVGSNFLSDDNLKIFEETVEKIEFRTGNTHAPKKICSLKTEDKTQIFLETQAVFFSIPKDLKSYVLWQLGHGDWQQAVIVDGSPMREAFIRAEGISGAVKKLSEILNLSSAEADRAWRMNTIPKMDGMNGERVDCTSEKKRALTEHVNSIIGKLLNSNDPYRERTKNIILSGGGAKDDLVFQVLKREVEIDGLYKLHKISDLPFKNENCSDPSLTCVMGLLEKGDLGLDVGNSFLKGAYI